MIFDPYKQSIPQHTRNSLHYVIECSLENLANGSIEIGEYVHSNKLLSTNSKKRDFLESLCIWLESTQREQGDLLSTRREMYEDYQRYLLKIIQNKITGINILILHFSTSRFHKIFSAKHKHAFVRLKLSDAYIREAIKAMEFADLSCSKDADFLDIITQKGTTYYLSRERYANNLLHFISR